MAAGFIAAGAGWLLGRGRGWFWALLCPAAAAACAHGAMGLPALWLVLGWVSARDLREMEVPDLPWWIGAGAWLALGGEAPRMLGIVGGYFGFAFGLLLQRLSVSMAGKMAYGDADVLCGTLAGLYLGPMGVCVSMGAGAAVGLVYGVGLRLRERLGEKQPFPFLPALSLGVAVGSLISQFSIRTF